MCIKTLSQGSYLWNKWKGSGVANKKQIADDFTTQYWKNCYDTKCSVFIVFYIALLSPNLHHSCLKLLE